MDNDWKKRLGVVYSSNPDFNYQGEGEDDITTPPAHEQDIRVRPEKKGRNGKTVTLITGFRGSSEDIDVLAKMLKQRCGTGGTAKEGEIIIQGDFVDKIISLLKDQNYKVKRSGG